MTSLSSRADISLCSGRIVPKVNAKTGLRPMGTVTEVSAVPRNEEAFETKENKGSDDGVHASMQGTSP